MRAAPPASLLPLLLLLALLAACERPAGDEARAPIDPDAEAADGRPAQTPLAAPGVEGDAPADATATLEPIGGSGVAGIVQFEARERGVLVVAEVGGLPAGAAGLRILEVRSCGQAVDAPGAPESEQTGQLPQIDILDDGSGRFEGVRPGLRLDAIIGRVIVVTTAGRDAPVACGVIGPAV